jgi:hypothetical protein
MLLIIDVNSVLGLLHRVYVGDVEDISEANAPSIFSVSFLELLSFLIVLCPVF